MRPDRVQIEPAGVTAGKSFSGSNTLLKKFVREYMATSATISMTFASVWPASRTAFRSPSPTLPRRCEFYQTVRMPIDPDPVPMRCQTPYGVVLYKLLPCPPQERETVIALAIYLNNSQAVSPGFCGG